MHGSPEGKRHHSKRLDARAIPEGLFARRKPGGRSPISSEIGGKKRASQMNEVLSGDPTLYATEWETATSLK
ncbi:hypothetical protein MTO96_042667 [Rhipicephalus appendiculatus]